MELEGLAIDLILLALKLTTNVDVLKQRLTDSGDLGVLSTLW
jgi:hypothetical protein